ncbi:acyl-CoA dehydrogenase family protein [Effusibacillus dendaii]|uniref:Acyl-CoA dehydrogenase n=1 Tax=Effusibacillus dendaii TaxID=2743772 RepID=A0A7I8D8C0_9BACL|nr:acyl-CoA dehydrogenase family protein [Effusibacillus dendaii]BCJ85612.1 acyl-CoA dehydrogenase [Effusibacillus dendaii]
MNEMRKMIIDSVTKIMKDFCSKEMINESEHGAWAGQLWKTLAEAGMITVAVSEEVGGTGGDYGDALSILRISGKYSAPIPLAETYMANWLLAELGLPIYEQPLTILPFENNGTIEVRRNANGMTICGTAKNVPWARYAEKLVVMGQSEQEFLVAVIDPDDCIIIPGKNLAGEARDIVELNGVEMQDCPYAAVDGEAVQNKLQSYGALTRSVLMAGALERILELALAYSNERQQFGRSLNRFQAIQQQIAILAGEVAAAGVAADYAVEAFTDAVNPTETIVAKIRIGQAASIAAPIAHQIHGAIGFTDEHVLHQSTRRLWSWRDEFGTESEWAEQLGKRLMNTGAGSLWSFITL